MSFFEGLVVTEEGAPVSVAYIGTTSYYVIDDEGGCPFRIDALRNENGNVSPKPRSLDPRIPQSLGLLLCTSDFSHLASDI